MKHKIIYVVLGAAMINCVYAMEGLKKLHEQSKKGSSSPVLKRSRSYEARSYEEKNNVPLPTGKGALILHLRDLRTITDNIFPDHQSIQAVQTLLDATDVYNIIYLDQLYVTFMEVVTLISQVPNQDSQNQLLYYAQQFQNRITSEQQRLEKKMIARSTSSHGILRATAEM